MTARRILVLLLLLALPILGFVLTRSPLAPVGAGFAQPLDAGKTADPSAMPVTPPLSKDCSAIGGVSPGDYALKRVRVALSERKLVKILTIGASSSGGRDTGNGSYYSEIEALLKRVVPGLKVQIVDRGVSGEMARDAGERIKVEVALNDPDLILWQVGTSDALARLPLDEFRVSVTNTLIWLQKHDIDVVLVGLHYIKSLRSDPDYQSFRTTLKQVADATGVMRIGRYEAMQFIEQSADTQDHTRSSEFTRTEAGYSCLAEYVTRALVAGLFARGGRQP